MGSYLCIDHSFAGKDLNGVRIYMVHLHMNRPSIQSEYAELDSAQGLLQADGGIVDQIVSVALEAVVRLRLQGEHDISRNHTWRFVTLIFERYFSACNAKECYSKMPISG